MLKTLGRETKGFRLVSVLTPIFMIAEVIMEMIIPKLMASIIDNGVTPGNMQVIYTVGAQMVVAALFGLLFGILGAVAGSHAATGFARNLRRGMFRNIQTFSFANIDKYSTAGLVTRMTTDVTNVQNAFQMIERMCVRAPVHLIFALFMAVMIGGPLSLIFVVAVVFLVIVLASIMIPTFHIFDRVFKNYDALNASVHSLIFLLPTNFLNRIKNHFSRNLVNCCLSYFLLQSWMRDPSNANSSFQAQISFIKCSICCLSFLFYSCKNQ